MLVFCGLVFIGYLVCLFGGVFQALFMTPVEPCKINEIEAVMFGWGGKK